MAVKSKIPSGMDFDRYSRAPFNCVQLLSGLGSHIFGGFGCSGVWNKHQQGCSVAKSNEQGAGLPHDKQTRAGLATYYLNLEQSLDIDVIFEISLLLEFKLLGARKKKFNLTGLSRLDRIKNPEIRRRMDAEETVLTRTENKNLNSVSGGDDDGGDLHRDGLSSWRTGLRILPVRGRDGRDDDARDRLQQRKKSIFK
ncbi:hypothetical protein C0J52_13844 [Blattella germanica]|nr:hypothetical protein C0J52_13844 [Blattella germanica]